MVALTRKHIAPATLLKSVRGTKYGGVALFLGEVRGQSAGRVTRLEYSAYEAMALKMMRQIKREILKKWSGRGIGKVAMVHRLGALSAGERAVGVAVSARHRKEAFEACRYGIDRIKSAVPIFKKEFFSDGRSHWVECE